MKTGTIGLTALLISMPVTHQAMAAGDAAAGQEKSAACQACHGTDGRGADPSFPVLAGQHASYLAQALRDYREGKRRNPVMSGFALNLSDRDIDDLAAWYASLEGLTDLSDH
jgi:cytochrome c553